MYTLYKENIEEIISYLKPKDCYHFTLTCKLYHNNFDIKQSLINEINNRLGCIFGDKMNDFKEMLMSIGCFISGSFIIQCLLDEYWPKSDIDIYVPMIGNQVYYPDDMFMKTDVDDFMYYEMDFDGWHDSVDLGEYLGKGTKIHDCLKYVRTYVIPDGKYDIQIIGLDISRSLKEIKDFVDETFDFPICKNIYYYDRKECVLLNDMGKTFEKETVFRVGKNSKLTIKRYHKYNSNGIVFTNKDNLTYNDIKPIKKIYIIFVNMIVWLSFLVMI